MGATVHIHSNMLTDDVYLVAGGAHGLGKATAFELQELGATVVVNDLGTGVHGEGQDEEPVEETVNHLQKKGGEAMAHFGDVCSLSYTEELIQDTIDAYGRLDGVVNFAGIFEHVPVHEMSAEQWDDVLTVHLRGHFSLLRNSAPYWLERADDRDRPASFVTLSSRAALGRTNQLNYVTAKAGLLGMTRGAARELAPAVRVNSVLPSAYTRQIEALGGGMDEQEKHPRKVTPLIAYLLSAYADEVSGRAFYAGGNEIGIYSDPALQRVAVHDSGWSVEDFRDGFDDLMGQELGIDGQ